MGDVTTFAFLMLGGLSTILILIILYERKIKTSDLFAFFAFLVSSLTLYLTFFWHPEDFKAYFRIPERIDMLSDTLPVNYFLVNDGKNPIMIEDVAVINIWINSNNYNKTGADLSLCKDWRIRPDYHRLVPEEYRNQQFILSDDEQYGVYWPTSVYIDNTEYKTATAIIDEGKIREISTWFKFEKLPTEKFDSVIFCPSISFFDHSGKPYIAVCEGWQAITGKKVGGGTLFTGLVPTAELLPIPAQSEKCTVSPQ